MSDDPKRKQTGKSVRVTLSNPAHAASFFEFIARELREERLLSVHIDMPREGVGHGDVTLAPSRDSDRAEDFDLQATLPGAVLDLSSTDDEATHVHADFWQGTPDEAALEEEEREKTIVGPVPAPPGSGDDRSS